MSRFPHSQTAFTAPHEHRIPGYCICVRVLEIQSKYKVSMLGLQLNQLGEVREMRGH